MLLHYLSQRYIKKGDTIIDANTGVEYHVLGIHGGTIIGINEKLQKFSISIESVRYVSSQKDQNEFTYIKYRLPLVISPGDYILHSEELIEGKILKVNTTSHTVSVGIHGSKNKVDAEWKIDNILPKKSEGLYE